ncbi:DUF2157 domain-containing protein [Leptospira gomenensis]|uniref:DUF2157 domain-containing protein n=1 Tax=Leptospira gomenensis TaxID=2484974 RepID=A0A5F1YCE9_9LEPT|nr:DUF2157 domain-containing protein [Leptospira gomenensis]TGK35469.1 DUF2157 domain-containing protein [Leptospira gomenensis]TGK40639.1 DUF2157 domain-containing protein [Leptospira gomenensis]TGK46317.1 DUF2157 domain-containing protein [Leptospira gomenensis]TGK66452.1 DUF2157 domain-containing protein [Leptospira gomenensis]
MRLEQKLQRWVDAGLIRADQSEAILGFEEHKKTPYLYYSFLILGASVIGIGVIAIVAANWEDISDFFKLGFALSLLVSTAAVAFWKRENSNLSTVIIVLYSILVLGMIGLVSQIYNLEGKYYQAAALWCVLNALFLWATDSKTFLHLWIVGFQIFVTGWIWEQEHPVTTSYWNEYFYFSAVVFFIVWQMAERFSWESRKGSLFQWTMLFLVAGSCYRGFFEGRPYEVLIEQGWLSSEYRFPWWNVGLRLAILIPVIYFLFRNTSVTATQRKSLTFSFFFLFLSYFPLPFQYVMADTFRAHVWNYFLALIPSLLFIFFWLGIASAFRSHKRIFDLSVAIIGVRFLFYYFDVFGTLTYTGFGLIFSGLLIIGVTVSYLRLKGKMRTLLGEKE